ncbi:Mitochondrial ribosome-associated GTPase [Dirofilaria immitis]|nr:Mitochondrial GTPase 1 [Dirofilaria immitis]
MWLIRRQCFACLWDRSVVLANMTLLNCVRRRNIGDATNKMPKVQCREHYLLPTKFDFRVWFPLHMSVQLKQMIGKLRTVDLIIEVHDARKIADNIKIRVELIITDNCLNVPRWS